MSLLEIDERKLKDRMPAGLLDSIVAKLNPIRVIVFGSQVTGNTHIDSDWDLLIVVDDDTPTHRIDSGGLDNVRCHIRGAMDLIPLRETNFRDRVDIIGSLPWIALNEGAVVYERSSAD